MPVCFQLTRIGDSKPASLVSIDNAICQHFGVNAHEKQYYRHWYDTIGLMLALGHSFHDVIDRLWEYEDYERLPIAAWLAEHYTPDAWREHK